MEMENEKELRETARMRAHTNAVSNDPWIVYDATHARATHHYSFRSTAFSMENGNFWLKANRASCFHYYVSHFEAIKLVDSEHLNERRTRSRNLEWKSKTETEKCLPTCGNFNHNPSTGKRVELHGGIERQWVFISVVDWCLCTSQHGCDGTSATATNQIKYLLRILNDTDKHRIVFRKKRKKIINQIRQHKNAIERRR